MLMKDELGRGTHSFTHILPYVCSNNIRNIRHVYLDMYDLRLPKG